MQGSSKSLVATEKQGEDKPILGFCDNEKVSGIPNATPPLVVSCNCLYNELFGVRDPY